jgi:predicted RNA binding protein YcfA (HicA-like mRNA interferase family)
LSKLPRISGKDDIKALTKAGFAVEGSGRHGVELRHPDGRRTTVPYHQELDRGTPHAIIVQAGLTREEFLKLL